MPTAMTDPLKSLKIKHGVLKRTKKDLLVYQKEMEKVRNTVAKMKEDNKDPHDIKQQEEVLKETTDMVPETQKRLKEAYADVEQLLALNFSDEMGKLPEEPIPEDAELSDLQKELAGVRTTMKDTREVLPDVAEVAGAAGEGEI
ncbi:unnamed protein product [Vitrella brassicaformis CCMP3155]|uniref:Tubulin-specific chaperone A n=1 Tax=Vitrella brassicaformis (strain CCMP3155) TaxID=1169540 RepID=A0A0G4EFK3_VITBC|nr:unnamed protein product [Vitrella brassicaformis CCMP3155]|mmetsp:Transcript_19994/g.48528  ORF Transcript_19994/g.48528 Transcript_19994/m.48528 type:complete len:144 (-) Transcript_19994:422-853(-)|eukprot:CEL94153.1 unnamed protein product [Vitrella brassicaformis CCMP3155]